MNHHSDLPADASPPVWRNIVEAVENGTIDDVKYFVEQGTDVNEYIDSETPLYVAASRNNFEMVKYLIERGADVNAKIDGMWSPLYEAVSNDNLEMVTYLVEKGADVNAYDCCIGTPISGAIGPGATGANCFKIVKYLIEHGAWVDWELCHGGTPLGAAKRAGNLEILNLIESNIEKERILREMNGKTRE